MLATRGQFRFVFRRMIDAHGHILFSVISVSASFARNPRSIWNYYYYAVGTANAVAIYDSERHDTFIELSPGRAPLSELCHSHERFKRMSSTTAHVS